MRNDDVGMMVWCSFGRLRTGLASGMRGWLRDDDVDIVDGLVVLGMGG